MEDFNLVFPVLQVPKQAGQSVKLRKSRRPKCETCSEKIISNLFLPIKIQQFTSCLDLKCQTGNQLVILSQFSLTERPTWLVISKTKQVETVFFLLNYIVSPRKGSVHRFVSERLIRGRGGNINGVG